MAILPPKNSNPSLTFDRHLVSNSDHFGYQTLLLALLHNSFKDLSHEKLLLMPDVSM